MLSNDSYHNWRQAVDYVMSKNKVYTHAGITLTKIGDFFDNIYNEDLILIETPLYFKYMSPLEAIGYLYQNVEYYHEYNQ